MCRLSWNLGSLNLLEPSGSVQGCNGIALPFTHCIQYTLCAINFFQKKKKGIPWCTSEHRSSTGVHKPLTTKCRTVVSNNFGPSFGNLIYVTLLASRIFRWLLPFFYFWNTAVLLIRKIYSVVYVRGELSYLAPLGSENISAPYFKQCFFQGGGITPHTESNTTPPSPKTSLLLCL